MAEPQKAENVDNTDPEKAAYYAVLEKLYTTYTLPDGTELGYDEISDLSWNKFAIYDIDQDGKEELLIQWTDTYTAGMAGIIYGFDSASGTVKAELWEYPLQVFYDNGVVEVGLSHNHGLAGEIDDFYFILSTSMIKIRIFIRWLHKWMHGTRHIMKRIMITIRFRTNLMRTEMEFCTK